jgi:hypothetical protein
VTDFSGEIKQAAANRDRCCVGLQFCGEKGRGFGAEAMGKGEEEWCLSGGGKGEDERLLLFWCLHEEMRRRGEYMVGFAAWVHALERIKMGESKNGVKRGLRGGGLLLFDGE